MIVASQESIRRDKAALTTQGSSGTYQLDQHLKQRPVQPKKKAGNWKDQENKREIWHTEIGPGRLVVWKIQIM
jgi:hypothetical protein